MHPDQLCAEAQNHHFAGNLPRAEALYTTALRLDPNHPDSLHLLGRLTLTKNQPDRAIALINQAITIKPRTAAYRESLGLALRAVNRNEDAITAFRHAIRLEKSSFGAHYNLGNALDALRQHAEAAQSFRRAIAIDPHFPGAHNNLGNALRAQKNYARAAEAFQSAIALDPKSAELHFNLAAVLVELKDDAGAIHALHQVLALSPSHKQALLLLSGTCLRMGDFTGAEQALRRAIATSPGDATLISELAIHMRMQGREDEAGAYFQDALAHAPDEARFYHNYGLWLEKNGDLAGSETQLRTGLLLSPDDPMLRSSLALTLLCRGKWREGFAAYEWRWKARNLQPPQTAPAWTGALDPSKTLLIVAEQGQGDVIHFLRYVPLAANRMRVVLEVYPSLHRLAATLPGVATLLRTGDATPHHHTVCPLMSLPHVLGQDETVLGMDPENPYLRPDPTGSARWAARVAALQGLKIGLVWAGGASFDYDKYRSIPPHLLDQLAHENISFISLQTGREEKPGLPLNDWTDDLTDFAETAALIANLDLVISVDTAVAHLAGAVGKPVWLLNRFDSDWRWLREDETTAWYPTMRIFRQPKPGDWPAVIAAVQTALTQLPPPHTR